MMRVALLVYGTTFLVFAAITGIVGGFSHWPPGNERVLWHQLAFAAVSFLGARAWGKECTGAKEE